ncbi:MAG: aconitate hydratase AcnA [bacterium]|nr:aconitate hydratase AcnA [bacterium]
MRIYDISKYKNLPFTIKILLENTLRHNFLDEAEKLKNYKSNIGYTINFFPYRIILQDYTGVPLLVDLAALRSELSRRRIDPKVVNPRIKTDLVVDHSLIVDYWASPNAFEKNLEMEYKRNYERYRFLKWAQKSFKNLNIFPPGAGIIHQVNLEYLAEVVVIKDDVLFPDTLLGTDSHTTMINGLGVLGFGVGGVEAENCMLGESYPLPIPEVIGVKLKGKLNKGVYATDLVLTITNILRKYGVVEKFVEFFGEGVKNLTVEDRATISNMSPEYGATVGFFPVDEKTLDYLLKTGRSKELVDRVKFYTNAQGLFYKGDEEIDYVDVIEVDLNSIEPTVAGPKRPHDRVSLSKIYDSFKANFEVKSVSSKLKDGDVVIAAITSCTNTSNPEVLIAAALVAKNAIKNGLKPKWYVKTSFAPGSRAVVKYLEELGLKKYLDEIGFNVVGIGCTTCIGNSGPLPKEIEEEIRKYNLNVVSVLSGNRNFEARIHPLVKANYLMSPPLVVLYSIIGNLEQKLERYLELLPLKEEVYSYIQNIDSSIYTKSYSDILKGDAFWNSIDISDSILYDWAPSTYIVEPPFFKEVKRFSPIRNARVIAVFGDSITTDHISPAGSIPPDSPAGKYLISKGVSFEDFNSFGARRGNHEVMMRGTFGNLRIKNRLLDVVGPYAYLDGVRSIYEVCMELKSKGVDMVVVGGKEYGSGSSRDWAAKGPALLGVKAIIARSFERIHRSNLVAMGVLPLEVDDENFSEDFFDVNSTVNIYGELGVNSTMEVEVMPSGKKFKVRARINSQRELEYIKEGGIFSFILKKLVNY